MDAPRRLGSVVIVVPFIIITIIILFDYFLFLCGRMTTCCVEYYFVTARPAGRAGRCFWLVRPRNVADLGLSAAVCPLSTGMCAFPKGCHYVPALSGLYTLRPEDVTLENCFLTRYLENHTHKKLKNIGNISRHV